MWLKLILVMMSCMVCVSAQSYSYNPSNIERTNMIQEMPTMLVEWATRAFQYIMTSLQLKIHSVRFITELYTEQNLALFRRFLSMVLRFGNWFYDIIPTNTAEGASRFIKYLFPNHDAGTRNPYMYGKPSVIQNSLSITDEERVSNLANFINSGQARTTMKPIRTRDMSTDDAAVDEILGQLDLNAIINGE